VKRTSARHERRRMPLASYLAYCEASDEADPLYLTDWHYQASHPELRDLMKPPRAFQSWLDFLPRRQRPVWSWFYIGPRNSKAPMHLDVGMSSAWNVVFSGCKEWATYRPDHPISLELRSGAKVSPGGSPDQPLTCVQFQGDLIYVPGGWAHSVHNR